MNDLIKAGTRLANAKATEIEFGIAEKVALWFMTLFLLMMLWQLYRGLDSFAVLMGL